MLVGAMDRIANEIKIGHVGAYMYDRDDEYGYDLVMWNSIPYTLQQDNRKFDLKQGDRVINVTNLYRIQNRNNWYHSSSTKSILKLLHVVVADIIMKTDSFPHVFS